MNKQQVVELVTLLQTEYPQSFTRLDARQMAAKINLWQDEFKDDNSEEVYTAVRTLMRSGRQWAPTFGEIREKMRSMNAPEELSETAVLDIISRAAANGTYHADEEFKKLPPELQEIVHSPTQLREWAMMDADSFKTVIGSFVMKSYTAGIRRAKERAALPESVRGLIGGLSDKLALGGGQ